MLSSITAKEYFFFAIFLLESVYKYIQNKKFYSIYSSILIGTTLTKIKQLYA